MKKFLVIGTVFLCIIGSVHAADAANIRTVILDTVSQYNSNQVEAEWLTDAICYSAALYGVDPLLVTALMENESHFSFSTFTYTSKAGAIGLMQLMPGTAREIGVNPYDPFENVKGGTSYLRLMLDKFAGYGSYAITDAVAAYNAGPISVIQYGGCPPYKETINYVIGVNNAYQRMLANYYYQ